MANGENRSDYIRSLQSMHAVTNYSQCHHHFVPQMVFAPQMIMSCADQIMVSQLTESRTHSFQTTQPEFTVSITHTTDNIIHTKLSLQKAFSPKHQEELSIQMDTSIQSYTLPALSSLQLEHPMHTDTRDYWPWTCCGWIQTWRPAGWVCGITPAAQRSSAGTATGAGKQHTCKQTFRCFAKPWIENLTLHWILHFALGAGLV